MRFVSLHGRFFSQRIAPSLSLTRKVKPDAGKNIPGLPEMIACNDSRNEYTRHILQSETRQGTASTHK